MRPFSCASSVVCVSVSMCKLPQTAKPVVNRGLGDRLVRVGPTNRAIDGGWDSPTGRGYFEGDVRGRCAGGPL